MTHDKNTCGICGGRDWFQPGWYKIVDQDLIELATEAHASEESLSRLHLARVLSKLYKHQ